MGEQQEVTRTQKLPAGLTISLIDDAFMVSLAAEWSGRVVATLRGWLGHPRGHIEIFEVNQEASPRQRYQSCVWLLRTFEGLLEAIGANGWTAMTNEQNAVMTRMLTARDAVILPGQHHIFVKEWRV